MTIDTHLEMIDALIGQSSLLAYFGQFVIDIATHDDPDERYLRIANHSPAAAMLLPGYLSYHLCIPCGNNIHEYQTDDDNMLYGLELSCSELEQVTPALQIIHERYDAFHQAIKALWSISGMYQLRLQGDSLIAIGSHETVARLLDHATIFSSLEQMNDLPQVPSFKQAQVSLSDLCDTAHTLQELKGIDTNASPIPRAA